jgi:hypothetical protein
MLQRKLPQEFTSGHSDNNQATYNLNSIWCSNKQY